MMCFRSSMPAFVVICLALAIVFHGVAGIVVRRSKAQLMVPQQHIRGSKTDTFWELSFDVSDPRIQCGKDTVTATLELITDGTVSETRNITASIPHEKRIHLYKSENLIEVALEPRNPSEECNPKADAAVTILVACEFCLWMDSVVKFSYGKPIAEITGHLVKPAPTYIVGDIRGARLISVIPDDLLLYRGGTTITAVIIFPQEKNSPKIENVYARPRGLLARNSSWYVKDMRGEGHGIFMSVQLPETWRERYIPRVMVDVECSHCHKFYIRFEPARPEWRAIKSEAALKQFSSQNVTSTRVRDHRVVDHTGDYYWKFKSEASELCGSVFDGAMHIAVAPLSAQLTFMFKVNNTLYKSNAIQSGSVWLVRWLPEDTSKFCSSDIDIVLLARCERCNAINVLSFALKPSEPELLEGSAPVVAMNFTSTWQNTKTCDINWQIDDFRISFSPFFRLWVDNHQCSLSQKNPFLDRSARRELFHSWETQLSNDAKNRFSQNLRPGPFSASVSLSGGSECLCHHLKAKAYQYLNLDYEDPNEPETLEIDSRGIPLPFNLTFHGYYYEESFAYKLFKNVLSLEEIQSPVPVVVTICLSVGVEVESVYLGDTYPIQEIPKVGYNNRCFAFDSCDVWRVMAQKQSTRLDIPILNITGHRVPPFIHWRADKAVRLDQEDLMANDVVKPSRGGWYGKGLEEKMLTSNDQLVKVKIEEFPTLHCVPVFSSSGTEGLRGNKIAELEQGNSAPIFIRPAYELESNTPLMREVHSGDWSNVQINALISLSVLGLVAAYL